MMAAILKFADTPFIDESIEEYEYDEHDPITGNNLNDSGGDMRISIECQDDHHCESYLIFDGRLTKADNTAYANADEVALTSNGIMHLFNRIEYHLSNEFIKSLNYSGARKANQEEISCFMPRVIPAEAEKFSI